MLRPWVLGRFGIDGKPVRPRVGGVAALTRRGPVTQAQLDFADWFSVQFKAAIEHLIAGDAKDEFEEYLVIWAVNLGVLALDVFEAVVLLLKANKERSAYIVSRALLDYHIRLRYYVIEAEAVRSEFLATNRKHPKNYLQKMQAYQDYTNTEDKLFAIIKGRDRHEWGDISEKEQQRILRKMEKVGNIHSRRVHEMLKTAEPKSVGDYYSHHQFQSGYLHGDQITFVDTIKSGTVAEKNIEVNWESQRLSGHITLGDSFLWCYEMLTSIEMFRGWAYAKDAAFQKAYFAFQRDIFDGPKP